MCRQSKTFPALLCSCLGPGRQCQVLVRKRRVGKEGRVEFTKTCQLPVQECTSVHTSNTEQCKLTIYYIYITIFSDCIISETRLQACRQATSADLKQHNWWQGKCECQALCHIYMCPVGSCILEKGPKTEAGTQRSGGWDKWERKKGWLNFSIGAVWPCSCYTQTDKTRQWCVQCVLLCLQGV